MMLLLLLSLLIPVYAAAQVQTQTQNQTQAQTQPAEPPPSTDIFLFDLSIQDSKITPGKSKNITDREGYDNQPFFIGQGSEMLYTSIRSNQADIFRYDIASGRHAQITNTPESEYSPTLMPDGNAISTVRVESDGTQRLWKFDLSGGSPELILPDVKPVGYHLWLDKFRLALFILGEPNTLQIADTRTGSTKVIAENIGRALHKIPGRNSISYVRKITEENWVIDEYNLETSEARELAPTLKESEDLVWTRSGLILMGQGSSLYYCNPAKSKEWTPVADLSSYGITAITRLALDPTETKLALVSEMK